MSETNVVRHFTERAARYNISSRWVDDPALGAATVAALDVAPHHQLLDVACGTGLVSKHFAGKVAQITGVDITAAMFEQARPYVDVRVVGPGEALPFPDASFDAILCRKVLGYVPESNHALDKFARLPESSPSNSEAHSTLLRPFSGSRAK